MKRLESANIFLLEVFLIGLTWISSVQGVEYRLPTQVDPISYTINLHPDYADLSDVTAFTGDVKILARVKNGVDRISLHVGNDIRITSIKVTNEDETNPLEIEPNQYTEVTEILVIKLKTPFKKDQNINIIMSFTGKLSTDMHGFYKSTYTVTDSKGVEESKMLLATQFEPVHARRAFPCFDEPKFKATFQVTLSVPNGYGALFNTEVERLEKDDTQYVFKETVKMSTYLLAFIVYEKASFGPSVVVVGTDDVRLTSWGRTVAMKNHLADYSQTITHRILTELDEFTKIPYSTDRVMMKVDQAAIPDFSSGAMENWGLVTYRETNLLYDEGNGTEASRQGVGFVIAHELTHQWFGNLVTMDWWSSTWLNEGFARFFQFFIMDKIHPQWRVMEQFVVDQQMNVFASDAQGSGVLLTRDVHSPLDIDGQFSSAAYSKGGAIVRLLNIVLGPEHFQMGLHDYLVNRSYTTATPEQLFEILSHHFQPDNSSSELQFTDLITWTNTSGYPVVRFQRDSSNQHVVINQERFYLDENSASNDIYPVYLEWTTNDGKRNKHWLLSKQDSSSVALPTSQEGWFIVNNTGYFRVNYDVENWKNLYIQLAKEDLSRISALDRATLLDNALNLARVNKLEYESALTLLRYLKRETDYIPWNAAFSGLSFLHRMLINVDESGVFNTFVATMLDEVYGFLGFQDRGDHLEKIQRATTLGWACRVGVEDCHNQAVKLLTAYIEQGQSVPANLRGVVYCYGIKSGPQDTWLKMWQQLQLNDDVSERSLLISALGCSRTYSTLYMYLEQSLSGDVIRQQDASSVFSAVYTNPDGVDAAVDFLVENFDRIEKTYVAMNALRNVVTGVANYITKEEQRSKMQILVDENPSSLEGIGKTALTTIDTNIKWLIKYKSDVITEMQSILMKEKNNEELW